MTVQTFDSVWDAIEDTPAEAANMRLRSDMIIAITNYIAASGMTQAAAAKKLGVTQPRISDLKRGKLSLFSLDMLVNMLANAGIVVRFETEEVRPARSRKGEAVAA